MRTRPILTAALLLAAAACGPGTAEVTPEARNAAAEKAAAAAKRLGGTLLTELTDALNAGPPEHAVHVCGDVAQAVSEETAAAQGFPLGRTSLRVRNPANASDAWERQVLVDWENAPADATPRSEIVDTPDGPALRWMAPIRLVGLCTKCHGDDTEIATATRAAIQERFPDDQATGFAVGDIRGGVTVTVPLE